MYLLPICHVFLALCSVAARSPHKPAHSKSVVNIEGAHQDRMNIILAREAAVAPASGPKDPLYMKVFPVYPQEIMKFLSLSMMVRAVYHDF